MKNNLQLLCTLFASQDSRKASLPSPSPLFFWALSDELTPATSTTYSTLFCKLHAWISWPTNDPSIPYLPWVYNTYSVVNFTSRWTQYPSYENKVNIFSCFKKWWKTHHHYNTWFTKISPNTIFFDKYGNMTSPSQFIMQLKIRPDIIVA